MFFSFCLNCIFVQHKQNNSSPSRLSQVKKQIAILRTSGYLFILLNEITLASNMNTERAEMENELKKHCVSLLREQNFKGSFPDLYRDVDGFVSLINFQFFSSGGSFCVNISYADKNRENIYFKKDTEPKKLKVSQARVHARLGAENLAGDKWFSFGKTSYGEFRGNPQLPSELVDEINRLILKVAIPWWSEKARGTESA